MNAKIPVLAMLLFAILISCKDAPKKEDTSADQSIVETETIGIIPESWIGKRVEKAKSRLTATAAGNIVWQAMEAHGGLAKWYTNGPLSFRFNYQPLDGGTPRDTYQAIDTWSSKARHFDVRDSTSQYGWTGKSAWMVAKDSTVFPYNTRFWSLTPYFFAAQPFVLDGQGVNLELLPAKEHKGRPQNVVKVTFEEGTGDAPDDYYILYFDAESHQLSVIRYIVSYPGYFNKGEHLPEKFMQLEGQQLASGILFPKSYKTHWLTKEEKPGEHITSITLSDVAFQSHLPAEFFDLPEGATLLEGY